MGFRQAQRANASPASRLAQRWLQPPVQASIRSFLATRPRVGARCSSSTSARTGTAAPAELSPLIELAEIDGVSASSTNERVISDRPSTTVGGHRPLRGSTRSPLATRPASGSAASAELRSLIALVEILRTSGLNQTVRGCASARDVSRETPRVSDDSFGSADAVSTSSTSGAATERFRAGVLDQRLSRFQGPSTSGNERSGPSRPAISTLFPRRGAPRTQVGRCFT